ncbi:Protein kinase domain-containing protein [Aphelenchoides besseyi]|nr:Protein kinase domain-containing protein [Aphelenchoides besseyi]KAI6235173.1 Protein kinase domain-containing protein [Aphelenchoides besseyi]
MKLLQCYGSTQQHIQVGVDKYKLRRVIAKGGFSTIYLAKKSGSSDEFAIKKIYAHSQLEVSRVRREVYSHDAFGDHEHLMKVLGVYRERFGEEASVFYLVMNYCPFGSVQDALDLHRKSNKLLDETDVLTYTRQLCQALDFMHRSQPSIAHRDVKPANLLLKTEKHVVLTDFGSAVMVPVEVTNYSDSLALKDEAAELCTMTYRAPELFSCEVGLRYDDRVDTWSVGCVLHALCFYASPFDEVVARGDSIPLAAMSYRFREAPISHSYSKELMEVLAFMLLVSSTDRPTCGLILQRLNEIPSKSESQ